MPEFQVHEPRTVQEAVEMWNTLPDSVFIAGGTDLLPNLKHRLLSPKHLVSLGRLDELRGIRTDAEGTLRIGACTSLHELATDSLVQERIPALARAAALIAGPQHRRMGTIGGNVMLDTRCLFYNQSEDWRRALGYCLKKDGDFCHVIGSKATCVAAQSSDTVPVLIALDATIDFAVPGARQSHALGTLYQMNGMDVHDLPKGALLTEIVIPAPRQRHLSTYRKVASRAAVDFPQVGVALVASFDGLVVTSLTGVVGAVMPRPKILRNLDAAVGTALEDPVIEEVAESAWKQVRPQTSIHGDNGWRRHMARVEVSRGLQWLREQAKS